MLVPLFRISRCLRSLKCALEKRKTGGVDSLLGGAGRHVDWHGAPCVGHLALLSQEGLARWHQRVSTAAQTRLNRQLMKIQALCREGALERWNSEFQVFSCIYTDLMIKAFTLLYHAVTISFSSYSLSLACSHSRCERHRNKRDVTQEHEKRV